MLIHPHFYYFYLEGERIQLIEGLAYLVLKEGELKVKELNKIISGARKLKHVQTIKLKPIPITRNK